MTIATIVLAITGVLGGEDVGTGGSPPKDKGWLDRLAYALKVLTGKSVEAVEAIIESVVGAILSFLKNTVGSVAEHTWTLIVFVGSLVGWWLMQKEKRVELDIRFFMISLRYKKFNSTGRGIFPLI